LQEAILAKKPAECGELPETEEANQEPEFARGSMLPLLHSDACCDHFKAKLETDIQLEPIDTIRKKELYFSPRNFTVFCKSVSIQFGTCKIRIFRKTLFPRKNPFGERQPQGNWSQ
jgi:hypothetical protein